MRDWLISLNLPWAHIKRRWAITLALGDLVQRVVDSAALALGEWSPVTARDHALAVWGAVLARPRRPGETLDAWRRRLVTWRSEKVATTGWVRDEVMRITGAVRVIDWPRDSMRYDAGRYDDGRYDDGPALLIGAPEAQIGAVRAHLDAELPPDIGLHVVEPAIFDEV